MDPPSFITHNPFAVPMTAHGKEPPPPPRLPFHSTGSSGDCRKNSFFLAAESLRSCRRASRRLTRRCAGVRAAGSGWPTIPQGGRWSEDSSSESDISIVARPRSPRSRSFRETDLRSFFPRSCDKRWAAGTNPKRECRITLVEPSLSLRVSVM
jgi:hypothetical protein